jgi:hypothetical protein
MDMLFHGGIGFAVGTLTFGIYWLSVVKQFMR